MVKKQLCDKKMTFQECELAILRNAVDRIQRTEGSNLIQQPQIKKIIEILESFLRKRRNICYGGTAINNILPLEDQFYDKSTELPDYDFFSANPVKDAIELADIYYKAGFNDVEAKAGVHHGTYKVYVNFIPIADITFLHNELFSNLKRESIQVNGILYASPNYLRMSMYLELSRPKGDVSRWEKVMKRLTLLNKHYPLQAMDCDVETIQRPFSLSESERVDPGIIFDTIRESFIDQGCVFFGALANELYTNTMKQYKGSLIDKIPDFDVLSEDPETTAVIVKERLRELGIKKVSIKKNAAIGEVVPEHYAVYINKDVVAFIYKTIACHSYNIKKIGSKKMRIATIDTLLSLYLAFLYIKNPIYNKNRILCISENLYKTQQQNRFAQSGILRRFTTTCYGKQATMESIRAEKADMFAKLKVDRNSAEYNEWFLRYIPAEASAADKKKIKKISTRKRKSKRSNKTRKQRKSLFSIMNKKK